MTHIAAILLYLLNVLLSTVLQLFILLGPFVFLAFLMHQISRQSEKLSVQVMGRKAFLYVFAWLGVSVHELSHALFCIIFGHRIDDIVLFSPNSNGTLGYVKHSYNRGSLYHNIGHFFIGLGPLIVGSLLLYVISYFLFGFHTGLIQHIELKAETLYNLSALKMTGAAVLTNMKTYYHLIFNGTFTAWWKVVLLTYLLYAIGSSMTLSSADIKSASTGFFFFVIILFFFNLLTLWIGSFTKDAFISLSNRFSILYVLVIMSMIINLIFVFILLAINAIKGLANTRPK